MRNHETSSLDLSSTLSWFRVKYIFYLSNAYFYLLWSVFFSVCHPLLQFIFYSFINVQLFTSKSIVLLLYMYIRVKCTLHVKSIAKIRGYSHEKYNSFRKFYFVRLCLVVFSVHLLSIIWMKIKTRLVFFCC